MERVDEVKEVLARWAFALRELIREVGQELFVVLEGRPERLDREFVVVRDSDVSDSCLFEQLLLTC